MSPFPPFSNAATKLQGKVMRFRLVVSVPLTVMTFVVSVVALVVLAWLGKPPYVAYEIVIGGLVSAWWDTLLVWYRIRMGTFGNHAWDVQQAWRVAAAHLKRKD